MGVTELERGKMYWKVIKSLGKPNKKSNITKIIVLSNTKFSDKTDMPIVDTIVFPKRNKYSYTFPYVSTLFLGDYNIPENVYNQNRIFASQTEAEAYAAS